MAGSSREGEVVSNWGVTVVRVLDALEHVGPMTSGELARELDKHRDLIASVLTRLQRPSKRPVGPRRVYIADWRDEDEGQRIYLRAVYAAGNKKDAPKPARKNAAERSRRYRDNKRQQRIVLFNDTVTA